MMKKIVVTPYNTTKNQTYSGDDVLVINNKLFEGVEYRKTKLEICFHHCTFHGLVIENSEDIDFENVSISFWHCIIRDIKVEEITSTNINIYFANSIINGRVDSENLNRVEINNCLLLESIFLLNINEVKLSYTKENVFPRSWQKLFKIINLDFNSFKTKKQLYHISNSKEITCSQADGIVEGYRFDRRPWSLGSDDAVSYYLSEKELSSLNINLTINYSPQVEHKRTNIIKPKLYGFSVNGYAKGEVNVENGIIDNWYLHDFSSEIGASFHNIKAHDDGWADKKMEIKRCNLDNFSFDNIYFDSYKAINFFRNKFGETSITACSFPNSYDDFDKFYTIENIHYPDEKPDDYYNIRYNTFLQFKKAVEASGNIYESHKFQSVSKDALRKINEIGWWNRRILGLNSWSNDHGLSIAKPLGHILWVSITLYLFYLLSLGRLFNGNEIDWDLIGYYFKFLDITHWSNFLVAKSELNGFSMAIDFLNKVIVGFFIYQFIAAFRKYGKK